MGQEYNLNESNRVVLNSSGNGSCFLAPNGTERWHITRIAVVTNQSASATVIPTCGVYMDSISDENLYDKTYTGSQDATDADIWLEKGQQLHAQWLGGVTGTTGTISVFGKRVLY
jgi:outer membrane protein assembly factor BamB